MNGGMNAAAGLAAGESGDEDLRERVIAEVVNDRIVPFVVPAELTPTAR